MKKILGLSVAALMVMGLVGGGTWAYFNDIEVLEGNTLAAGTLYLNVGGGSAVPFSFSNMAPTNLGVDTGSREAANVTIKNDGSLAGKLKITVGTITNTEGTPGLVTSNGTLRWKLAGLEDDTTAGELGDYLKMALWVDMNGNGTLEADDLVARWNGSAMVVHTVTADNVSGWGGIQTAAADTAGLWNKVDDYATFEFTDIDLQAAGANTVKIWVYTWFENDPTLLSASSGWTGYGGGASHYLYKYGNMHAQNVAQGDSVEFDVEFFLEQADE